MGKPANRLSAAERAEVLAVLNSAEFVGRTPLHVFTWDITKLRGPTKGSYYDAYVMIDIYSRYVVGAWVHVTEPAVLAEEMMQEVFTLHGTPRVVHADRGTSMTSKTVATLLTDLGVVLSHVLRGCERQPVVAGLRNVSPDGSTLDRSDIGCEFGGCSKPRVAGC